MTSFKTRNSFWTGLAALSLLLLGGPALAQNTSSPDEIYQRASTAYEAGDYEQAKNDSQSACDLGHALACFDLGVMQERALGVPADLPAARIAYKKACDGEIAEACDRLGEMYFQAFGGPADKEKFYELRERACNLGSPVGCAVVVSRNTDLEEYYAATRENCERGGTDSCEVLAVLYKRENNPEWEEFFDRTLSLGQKECDEGWSDRCYNLDRIMRPDRLRPQDQELAETVKRKAQLVLVNDCNRGDFIRCYYLGELVGTRNSGLAKKVYGLACNGGIGQACDRWGWYLEEGFLKDLEPDLQGAREAYKKGCYATGPWGLACSNYSDMLKRSSYSDALVASRRGCELGYEFSCNEIERIEAQIERYESDCERGEQWACELI
ncbi:MAG: hypothetical protein CMK09_11240 [Ponticaulis sp.]|nr:hypothetical protein [Ponticaulis sp.]|tara:strand:+ start:4461 stop:5606 length:1146 start_codon:yes stop_codon:yes gene_type:complete